MLELLPHRTYLGYAPVLAVVDHHGVLPVVLVGAHQVDIRRAALADRVDGQNTLSQPMSLGEKWLEGAAGKHRERDASAWTAMPAAHATVPSPPPTAEAPRNGRPRRKHLGDVVAFVHLDDLGA